jgi:hypothetical protein
MARYLSFFRFSMGVPGGRRALSVNAK